MKLVMLQLEEIIVPLHTIRITRDRLDISVRGEDFSRKLCVLTEEDDVTLMMNVITDKIELGLEQDSNMIRLTSDILKVEFDRRKAIGSLGISSS